MPLALNEKQRMDWYSSMYTATQTLDWMPGSYNPRAPQGLKKQIPMAAFIENIAAKPPTKCNCWEAVLIAAIDAGIYTKQQVKAVLQPVSHVARTKLIRYMYTSPDTIVAYGESDPIDLPTSSIIMFGTDGSHFALSVGGETILDVDRSHKGLTSLTELRKTGYKGETYYPMYVKRPPMIPGDIR